MNGEFEVARFLLTTAFALIGGLGTLRTTGAWPKWQSALASISVFVLCACLAFFITKGTFGKTSNDQINDASTAGNSVMPTIVIQNLGQPQGATPAPPMKKETRKRTQNFAQRNGHCEGPRDVKWSVKADEGWEIDVESIKVTPTVQSSKSIYDGITGARHGFDFSRKGCIGS